MRGLRRSCAIIAVILALATAPAGAPAQDRSESDAYAWLQYGADGHPHVRVIPSDRAACPAASADERGIALTVRVVAAAGFDRELCDAPLPLGTRSVRVAGLTLPPLAQRVARFIVLGDTGCRIGSDGVQDCNDRRAWPFARIAESIAREAPRPDLIVHVGDYLYREAPCPARDRRCADSPYGDDWSAWAVDFFEPGAPLFAAAPARAGTGVPHRR